MPGDGLKSVFDEVTGFEKFWASVRMAIMNRQPGLTWADLSGMDINDFFQVLRLSEKKDAREEKPGKRGRR